MYRLCATCGVENQAPLDSVCAICADDREWVPQDGQRWVTMDELSDDGTRVELELLEDGLLDLRCVPEVGIGHHGKLVCGRNGNVLWDPLGFVDESAVKAVVAHGDVIAIVASHPHVFGAQVQWSHLLGGPPVYVNAADAAWVMRPDPAIKQWTGTLELTRSLTVVQVGGHFPGSAVASWRDGAGGRGVLLTGDTISPNPDGRTVGFLRSYPNRIPLSPNVANRMATTLSTLNFDRIYGLFGNVIQSDALRSVQYSVARYCAWVSGEYDHLT